MSDDERDPVLASCEDAVLTVTLNRPHARNALDIPAWVRLLDAVTNLPSGARVIVITGAPPAFSAGADLNSAHSSPEPGLYGGSQLLMRAQEVIRAIYECPLPIVAAVNGPAAGIGWSVALACDLLIAARSAFFVAPFLQRGLVPDGGMAWTLTQSLGRHRALATFLTGRRISAEEGRHLGFISEVVDDDQLLSHTAACASDLATGATETIGLVKNLVKCSAEMSLPSFLHIELDTVVLNRSTGNPAEGIAAWREKRDAAFEARAPLPGSRQ